MTNSNTEHSRQLRLRTTAEWKTNKRASGHRTISVMLPPSTLQQIGLLTLVYDGKMKNVIIAAVDSLFKDLKGKM